MRRVEARAGVSRRRQHAGRNMSKLLHALLIGAAALLLAPSIAAAENPAASGRDGRQVFTTGFGSSKSATAEKSDKSTKKAERKAEKKKVERQAAKKAKAEELPKPEHVELRSDTQERGLFSALFGGGPQMLPETRRRDAELRERDARKKKFNVKADFVPQVVDYSSGYKRGTIVVDTSEKRLYLIESSGKARRYAIAVGRDGLKFKGKGTIADKQEWPRWIPTKDMQEREPKKYGQYKDGMPGGPDNPLGARAMYLYQGKRDTHIRVHGTNQPWTIGTDSSNGCFRMINEHVMDLYTRVRVGADMVVL